MREVIYTAEQKLIAEIIHVFDKIPVAVIKVKRDRILTQGQEIRIVSKPNPKTGRPKIDFKQVVKRMQINHQDIQEANDPNVEVGLQVDQKVKEGCCIFEV